MIFQASQSHSSFFQILKLSVADCWPLVSGPTGHCYGTIVEKLGHPRAVKMEETTEQKPIRSLYPRSMFPGSAFGGVGSVKYNIWPMMFSSFKAHQLSFEHLKKFTGGSQSL